MEWQQVVAADVGVIIITAVDCLHCIELGAVLSEEPLEVQSEDAESEVNPMVELVGKAISVGKPKGFFMQGVQSDDNPKL